MGTLRRPGIGIVLASFAGQAIIVVSGVVVARLLAVEERGQLALIVLLPLILTQLGGLGVPLAVTYKLAREPGSAGSIASVLGRVVPSQALFLVLIHFGLLAVLFSDGDGSVWTAALLTVSAVPAMLCQQIGLAVLQGRQRFSAFNVQRLVPLFMYAFILLLLALGGVGTLVACSLAWSVAWLLAGSITITTAVRDLRATRTDGDVDGKSFFRFGRRSLWGSIFPIETFQLDQLIVGLLLSPVALGLYVVAVALTNLPRFVAQSIGILAYPRIAAQSDHSAGAHLLWRYFGISFAVNTVIVGIFEVTAGNIVQLLFGVEYAGAIGIAQILLLAALLQSGRRVLADGARGLGHPELSSLAEVSSWFVLVPALVLLLPWGAQGVAMAVALMSATSLGMLVLGLVVRSRQWAAPTSGPDVTIRAEAATRSL